MKRDYLIIGQGIAGSCLALELLQRSKSVLVVDKTEQGAASIVAQGGINPIVFKRLTLAWEAQEIIPFAKKYYIGLENEWNVKIFHAKETYKIISNKENKRFWQSKINNPELYPFIGDIIENKNPLINAPFGFGKVNGSAQIDLLAFLNETKKILIEKDSFIDAKIGYGDIKINSEGIEWKDFQFEKVIFCDGFRAEENPLFSWLPFKNTKGTTLKLSIPNLKIEYILNKKISLIPQGDSSFLCGSSYAWEWENIQPDEPPKDELLSQLKAMLNCSFEVIEQKTGIRPTMKDRRPCFGQHPREKNVYIFNAGGSRGASIYPFFVNNLAENLIENKPLDKAVSIERFYKSFHYQ